MIFNYFIFLGCAFLVNTKNIPENNTAIISTYAKVAHWGAVSTTTPKTQSEGRSHSGQTLWTHRSDVKISGGQNLKTAKPKVIYQYPIQKVGQDNKDYPGVGEVQERFNPRPYFDYTHIPSKTQKTDSKPKPDASSFDSFPVFNPSASSATSDIYSSQYSSYNPPSTGPVSPPDNSNSDSYPPNVSPTSDDNNNDSDNGYHYNPPQDSAPTAPEGPPASNYQTLGPPIAPNYNDHYHNDHKEQVYYPPSNDGNSQETILDHPPPGWEEQNMDTNMPQPIDMNMGKAPVTNGHDMAEDDLSPPPSPNLNGQFPNYLYNGHGHDIDYDFDHHHVYKEITTTEAPQDERVNKGHYSYYYLGRKLWYIPLYFSVYFIIYVTVLILKSIARHKIQFKHQYLQKDMAKDMSKDMDHHGRAFNLDELYENVTNAIDTSKRKFPYIAM